MIDSNLISSDIINRFTDVVPSSAPAPTTADFSSTLSDELHHNHVAPPEDVSYSSSRSFDGPQASSVEPSDAHYSYSQPRNTSSSITFSARPTSSGDRADHNGTASAPVNSRSEASTSTTASADATSHDAARASDVAPASDAAPSSTPQSADGTQSAPTAQKAGAQTARPAADSQAQAKQTADSASGNTASAATDAATVVVTVQANLAAAGVGKAPLSDDASTSPKSDASAGSSANANATASDTADGNANVSNAASAVDGSADSRAENASTTAAKAALSKTLATLLNANVPLSKTIRAIATGLATVLSAKDAKAIPDLTKKIEQLLLTAVANAATPTEAATALSDKVAALLDTATSPDVHANAGRKKSLGSSDPTDAVLQAIYANLNATVLPQGVTHASKPSPASSTSTTALLLNQSAVVSGASETDAALLGTKNTSKSTGRKTAASDAQSSLTTASPIVRSNPSSVTPNTTATAQLPKDGQQNVALHADAVAITTNTTHDLLARTLARAANADAGRTETSGSSTVTTPSLLRELNAALEQILPSIIAKTHASTLATSFASVSTTTPSSVVAAASAGPTDSVSQPASATPAQAAQPAVPLEADDMIDQIVRGVSVHSLTTSPTVKVHLSPVELGDINVRVSVRDGVVSATFSAQHEATRNILIAQLPQLDRALSQSGLKISNVSVDVSSDGNGSHQSFQDFDGRKQSRRQSTPFASESVQADATPSERPASMMSAAHLRLLNQFV